jgi:hypothetical protein
MLRRPHFHLNGPDQQEPVIEAFASTLGPEGGTTPAPL